MSSVVTAWSVVFLMILTASVFPAVPALAGEPLVNAFPLTEGTVWIYEGPVKWTLPDSAEVTEEVLTWEMEVIETIQRQQVFAAMVKGHPLELAWYEEGKTKPGEHLIVRVGGDKYYLLSGDRAKDTWERLQDEDDILVDLVKDHELFLDLPLVPNKGFGETFQLTRQDWMYFWVVQGEEQVTLTDVKGLSSTDEMTQYELALRTIPAHQIVSFVPGIGFTHYVYSHHGTVAEMDLALVEYRAGGRQTGAARQSVL